MPVDNSSDLTTIPTDAAVLTVGGLRLALSDYHDADLVMVENGGFNDGVVVDFVKTVPHGMRVVIRAPESDWGPDSPGYDEMGQ